MNKKIHFRPDRLKKIRTNAGLNQQKFCEKIGCSHVSLSAYETGTKIPPTQTLLNVASEFDCSIDWLMGISDQANIAEKRKVETYSDIIKLLFQLQSSNIEFDTCSENFPNGSNCDIYFLDSVIFEFLKSWKRTKKLFEDGVIDSVIYQAWQEKVLKDFNYFIMDTDSKKEEFHDLCQSYIAQGLSDYDSTITALYNINNTIHIESSDVFERFKNISINIGHNSTLPTNNGTQ